MTDLATFSAVLTSLKTAADIAKTLKESDLSVERAETKLRIAELVGALADAKMAVADLQEELSSREQEIARLNTALSLREQVVRKFDAYYKNGPTGKANGDPFCPRCWEKDHMLYYLVSDHGKRSNCCPVCSTAVSFMHSPRGLTDERQG